MPPVVLSETYRRSTRLPVEWPGMCVTSSGNVSGRVYDSSLGGAFFKPDRPAAVVADSQVLLDVTYDNGEREVELPARIVWSGASQTHGCAGFGLEFV